MLENSISRTKAKRLAKRYVRDGVDPEDVGKKLSKDGYNSQLTGEPLTRAGVVALVKEETWPSHAAYQKKEAEKKARRKANGNGRAGAMAAARPVFVQKKNKPARQLEIIKRILGQTAVPAEERVNSALMIFEI